MPKRVKADLHCHLGRNGKFGNFNKVIDICYKKLGEEGVLGVANCNDFRYERFVNTFGYERQDLGNAVYVPKKKILIIKGQEIFTKDGDFLVIGLHKNKSLKSGRTLEDSLKEADDHNVVKIASHIFYKDGAGKRLEEKPELLQYFDGIEVYNSQAAFWVPGVTKRKANKRAEEYFLKAIKEGYNGGMVSFTDGHSIYVIGRSFTFLPRPDRTNFETLVNSLKEGIKNTKNTEFLEKHPSTLWSAKHVAEIAKDRILAKLSKK